MTQKTMYPTIIGDYVTELTAPYAAGIDTTISVSDTSFLPTAPNTCTIRVPKQLYLVTVRYTGKTLTTLTGVSVVQGEPAAAMTTTFAAGSELSKPLTQDDVQTIQDNIRDLDAVKISINQGVSQSGKYLRVGADGNVYCGDRGDSTAFADITGQPTDNAALAAALSLKANISTDSAVAFSVGADENGVYISI